MFEATAPETKENVVTEQLAKNPPKGKCRKIEVRCKRCGVLTATVLVDNPIIGDDGLLQIYKRFILRVHDDAFHRGRA